MLMETLASDIYEQILEDAPEGIVVISHLGTMLYCNRRFAANLGCASDELVGQDVSQLVHPSLRERHAQHLAHLRKSRDAAIFGMKREVGGWHKDGYNVPLELHVNRLWAGRDVKYVAIVSDIAERKQKELERQMYEEQIENLSDQLHATRQRVKSETLERNRAATQLQSDIEQLLKSLNLCTSLMQKNNNDYGMAQVLTLIAAQEEKIKVLRNGISALTHGNGF